MWNDRLRFAERVLDDWGGLSAVSRSTAAVAMERLDEDPILGAPLYEPLRGYWSYRLGTLRIVYQIVPEAGRIIVMKIQDVPEVMR